MQAMENYTRPQVSFVHLDEPNIEVFSYIAMPFSAPRD